MSHSKLGPSAAHRWMRCPGSTLYIDLMHDNHGIEIDGGSSPAANEGTLAHDIADKCLTENRQPREFLDYEKYGQVVNEEMVDHVSEYVAYAQGLGGPINSETRVDLSKYIPNTHGTADLIVVAGDTLKVVDLKYGRIPVLEHTQMMIYGLGALEMAKSDIKNVELTIYQPRIRAIETKYMSADELLWWGEYVLKVAAQKVGDVDETNIKSYLQPSRIACKWCPASDRCEAKNAVAFASLHGRKNVESISDEDFPAVAAEIELLKGHVAALEARLANTLEAGQPVEGFKLVHGPTKRRWKDERQAAEILAITMGEENIYANSKLKTPKQIENLLPKERQAELIKLIEKPDGKLIVVRDTDKRMAVMPTNMKLLDE